MSLNCIEKEISIKRNLYIENHLQILRKHQKHTNNVVFMYISFQYLLSMFKIYLRNYKNTHSTKIKHKPVNNMQHIIYNIFKS